VGFVNTGAGDPLLSNIVGDPTITISNITSGFSSDIVGPGSIHTGGAGTFDYDIRCNSATCGTGGNHPYTGSLTFDGAATDRARCFRGSGLLGTGRPVRDQCLAWLSSDGMSLLARLEGRRTQERAPSP
jgi:hypothetical protein